MRHAVRTALRLGRVSNLPTVWTNVLAGLALGGSGAALPLGLALAVAASSFYVGGMYLNDAFDHRWDAIHRPERPIPAGEIGAGTVFLAGFGMLAAALIIVAWSAGMAALGAGLSLAGLIVLYDVHHKGHPAAALVMALCRVAVYALAALAISPRPTPALYIAAALLFAYLVGLTLIARHESRHPRLPDLVGRLIAGICLLDAVVLAAVGRWLWAVAAVAGFFLTRQLQRRIAGT